MMLKIDGCNPSSSSSICCGIGQSKNNIRKVQYETNSKDQCLLNGDRERIGRNREG